MCPADMGRFGPEANVRWTTASINRRPEPIRASHAATPHLPESRPLDRHTGARCVGRKNRKLSNVAGIAAAHDYGRHRDGREHPKGASLGFNGIFAGTDRNALATYSRLQPFRCVSMSTRFFQLSHLHRGRPGEGISHASSCVEGIES